MVKRWPLVLAGLAAALAMVVVLAVWFSAPGEPIGPGGYSRVRLGMTEAEAERAVGLPPGLHTQDPRAGITLPSMARGVSLKAQKGLLLESLREREKADPESITHQSWSGDGYSLCVAFDGADEAVGVYLLEVYKPYNPPPTFLDRLRALIGL